MTEKSQITVGDESQKLSFKQELINHLIWLGIFNTLFAYFSVQMEKGSIGTVGRIIYFISSLFLFGFLFAFTKVLKRKFKNIFVSFAVSLVFMLIVNFILLSIFGARI